MKRCPWPKTDRAIAYHDQEWGTPLHDDRRLFEMLALSGIQAGLSWQIVLDKREAFRRAFREFDPAKVARFNEASLNRLLADAAIVRNRQKLSAVIENAKCVQALRAQAGSLDEYLWQFVEGRSITNRWRRIADVPTHTPLSDRVSHELRQRGFKFVGTKICYAFMQSIGMINDHLVDCFRHKELAP